MTRYFVIIPLIIIAHLAFSQEANDILIGANVDLIKTDNVNFASKIQIGLEGNYFITHQFTGTGGFEVWTGDDVSFIVGMRWFPTTDAFIRLRGLVGENDVSLGAGWTKPLTETLKFEAIGDFYLKGNFAIRAGLVFVLRKP